MVLIIKLSSGVSGAGRLMVFQQDVLSQEEVGLI